MKTKLIFLMLFGQILMSYGQYIQINKITPTAVSGGVNVNVLVTTFNGAGYLSHSYTVDGNTINLSVCYWFNNTLPVYQIEKDFLISVPNDIDYSINISIFHSSSQVECDYHSVGPIATINYLETENFKEAINKYSIFPNPSKGVIEIIGNESVVKHLSVYDNLGRLVKELNERISKDIDLGELKNGMYIVNIETENGSLNQKLIIKK